MGRFSGTGTYTSRPERYSAFLGPRPMTRDLRGRLRPMSTAEELYAKTPGVLTRHGRTMGVMGPAQGLTSNFMSPFASPVRRARERRELQQYYAGGPPAVSRTLRERLQRQRGQMVRRQQYIRGEWRPDYGRPQPQRQRQAPYVPSGKLGPDYKESESSLDTTKETIRTAFNEPEFLSKHGQKLSGKGPVFRLGSKMSSRAKRDTAIRRQR